jgi:phosphoglycerol transferase MdoB-like AlkP superfamily enzyme
MLSRTASHICFTVFVHLSLTASGLLAEPTHSSVQRKPNVLVLMTDDMSRHCVTATGGRQSITPNLDALASRGTVMQNVVHQGGFSGAICTCSRAMMCVSEDTRTEHGGCD